MTARAQTIATIQAPPYATAIWPARTMELLNLLRLHAMRCRVSARVDLFRACAMLVPDRTIAREAFAEALARVLSQALDQQTVFHRPGTPTLSFDEAWLARLVDCCLEGDEASLAFLLHRRVDPIKHRSLIHLVTGLVRADH